MVKKIYNLTGILCIVSIGGMLLGLETSSMAVFITSDHFNKYFKNPGSVAQGIIGGSNPAGAFGKFYTLDFLSFIQNFQVISWTNII